MFLLQGCDGGGRMTREEREDAINFFKEVAKREVGTYCKLAIEALKQEPCDDCISRQATVERLCKVADFMNEKRSGLGSPYIMAALFIQDNKDEFPSVTPKEKTGKWIDDGQYAEGHSEHAYRCSKCDEHYIGYVGEHKYCPNCGCRMFEPQESEE